MSMSPNCSRRSIRISAMTYSPANLIGFIERDGAGEVLHQHGRELLLGEHTLGDRGRDGRLEMIRRVPLPDVARDAVMKLVNEMIQLERVDFAPFQAIEVTPKVGQRTAQIAIVRNCRPLPDKALDVFGCVL